MSISDAGRFGWADRVDAALEVLERRLTVLEDSQTALGERLLEISAQTVTLVRLVKDIALVIRTNGPSEDDDDPVH